MLTCFLTKDKCISQFLDAKPFNDVGCPAHGQAAFWSDVHREAPDVGMYRIEGNSHVAFDIGWDIFSQQAHIVNESLLVMIAEARYDAIHLDCIEIVNNPEMVNP